ncbi:hypothetical protein [Zhenhengia yiwuensis]|uniref:hypothetical protein n=1 Tax=Zhenhengia yiwuensis TaxID=2763666 RepID=UPI002A75A30A|nr:hypothetical protein [Zhenhengia yiwuensis]MDY3366494.1 hypothetical protein [Zhenhengia yiwuensis]
MNFYERCTLQFIKEYQPLKNETVKLIEQLKLCKDETQANNLKQQIKLNAMHVKRADDIFGYLEDGADILKGLYTKKKGEKRLVKEVDEIDLYKQPKKVLKLLSRLAILLFGSIGMYCFEYSLYTDTPKRSK